jgi:hypothetical protein
MKNKAMEKAIRNQRRLPALAAIVMLVSVW